MHLHFTKMHALGNDFVVIDSTRSPLQLTPKQIAAICDRHFGIGCDQLLVVERTESDGVDFRYRIFNSDASEVGQCGNGARCFALFVRRNGLSDHNPLIVETISGDMSLTINDDDSVTVNMGVPEFEPTKVPFLEDAQRPVYAIDTSVGAQQISVVSMGNPHGVLIVDDVDSAPVASLGPELESHTLFPERANIGFMQIIDRQHVRLRVYERGAGETLACGSGACAAVAIGINRGLLDREVTVSLPGGELDIQWQNNEGPLLMSGPGTSVYTGEIEI